MKHKSLLTLISLLPLTLASCDEETPTSNVIEGKLVTDDLSQKLEFDWHSLDRRDGEIIDVYQSYDTVLINEFEYKIDITYKDGEKENKKLAEGVVNYNNNDFYLKSIVTENEKSTTSYLYQFKNKVYYSKPEFDKAKELKFYTTDGKETNPYCGRILFLNNVDDNDLNIFVNVFKPTYYYFSTHIYSDFDIYSKQEDIHDYGDTTFVLNPTTTKVSPDVRTEYYKFIKQKLNYLEIHDKEYIDENKTKKEVTLKLEIKKVDNISFEVPDN